MSKFPRNIRRHVYKILSKRHISKFVEPLYINGYSRFNSNCFFGSNCNFNGIRIAGRGKLLIGNNFHSGRELLIITEIHNYNGEAIPYDNSYILKDVEIGDNVWVGDRVTILGSISIGEGSIIQAGAVVVKDVPSYAIVGGNPAVQFKERDVKHYLTLKELKQFH